MSLIYWKPGDQCPRDLVNRAFEAEHPNTLWVADYTFVSTWKGFAYVAFVIDTYANRIVDWKLSSSQETQFVLDALEQAMHDRSIVTGEMIHHSDRGSQYVSIAYTERLMDAGIYPSISTVGDSYDSALAETIIGLYKTGLINNFGPWKTTNELELASLSWANWYNHERLLEKIVCISPAEYEAMYNDSNLNSAVIAQS